MPIIATGNDFSTLYAPLIRDGRMEKFYWSPTFKDRVGVACGIFKSDGVPEQDVEVLVRTFDGQSIDFFGALRARVYDDAVREWIKQVGAENMGPYLVNPSRDKGKVEFPEPRMTLDVLLQYGKMLEQEQENVKRVQLADAYLDGAVLAGADAPPTPRSPSSVKRATRLSGGARRVLRCCSVGRPPKTRGVGTSSKVVVARRRRPLLYE